MEEATILKYVIANMFLAFIAIEVDQARPVRISYTTSWWRVVYIMWIIGSTLSVPAILIYLWYLGGTV